MMYSEQVNMCQLYQDVNHINLFVGAMSEYHAPNVVVGPTFSYILKEQFERLRDGDRFFYKNNVFTTKQLDDVKKVTMASILCTNLKGIKTIHKKALENASPNNVRKTCTNIPKLNLDLWKDRF